jgi:hypothetical protein
LLIIIRLNESKSRDCDYIISVNFVTFLILWKIGKIEEAKRYLDINKRLLENLLEEDIITHMRHEEEEQKKQLLMLGVGGVLDGVMMGNAPNTTLSVILEST